MKPSLQPILEYRDVTDATFKNDIVPQYRPAVMRGFVKHWPVVKHAQDSPEAVCGYLMGLDSGKKVDVLLLPPEACGRVFYQPDLNGFNFIRNQLPISKVIEQIVRYSHFDNPPSVAVQSALIADCLPGFAAAHTMTALDAAVQPRIWMGNSIATPAHIDESNNIACVVAGKRRFTLFPPEQVANLYLGPLDYTPTGSPISLVDFANPDFNRFPKFREALAAAQVAELEPEQMPPEQRAGWNTMFEHFVFDAKADMAAHIPEARRGLLGDFSPEHAGEIREWLVRRLQD